MKTKDIIEYLQNQASYMKRSGSKKKSISLFLFFFLFLLCLFFFFLSFLFVFLFLFVLISFIFEDLGVGEKGKEKRTTIQTAIDFFSETTYWAASLILATPDEFESLFSLSLVQSFFSFFWTHLNFFSLSLPLFLFSFFSLFPSSLAKSKYQKSY